MRTRCHPRSCRRPAAPPAGNARVEAVGAACGRDPTARARNEALRSPIPLPPPTLTFLNIRLTPSRLVVSIRKASRLAEPADSMMSAHETVSKPPDILWGRASNRPSPIRGYRQTLRAGAGCGVGGCAAIVYGFRMHRARLRHLRRVAVVCRLIAAGGGLTRSWLPGMQRPGVAPDPCPHTAVQYPARSARFARHHDHHSHLPQTMQFPRSPSTPTCSLHFPWIMHSLPPIHDA